MGPLRMARHERLLPGGEPGIELLEGRRRLRFEPDDVVGNGDGVPVFPERPQLFELGFQFGNGLFEIEIASHQT